MRVCVKQNGQMLKRDRTTIAMVRARVCVAWRQTEQKLMCVCRVCMCVYGVC